MIAMAKPAYLAIAEFSPSKPVIAFVPSRKQCASTASDLLTYCIADDQESRFLHLEGSELEPHLEHVSDPTLADLLRHGIGYFHEALNAQDSLIVTKLFQSGAIQVVVASRVSNSCSHDALAHMSITGRKWHGVFHLHAIWSL
jgi:pre-mRNA-splicing helicase BRR2